MLWFYSYLIFQTEEKDSVSDSADQDQTAQNVQSDLDLYCPHKSSQLG